MASKDYYKILGVSKDASEADIKKAYRKLALKWHPDRCPPEKKEEAQKKFQEIGEAFDVLSDPEKKRMYDLGGGEMPFGGGDGGGGGFSGFSSSGGPGMRTFHFSSSNADDIFKRFFGTSNPFEAGGGGDDDFGGMGGGFGGFPGMMGGAGGPSMMFAGMPGMMAGGMPGGMAGGMPGGMGGGFRSSGNGAAKKAPSVTQDLNISLEDLYKGAKKHIRITSKRIIDVNTGQTQSVTSNKEINVKAGWKDGTKITFEREGDEAPGVIPADIVFVVKAKPHNRFTRDGDDLLYQCPVTLHEALTGVRKTVLSLDGRQIPIQAANVTPETMKIIAGEGMPNSKTGRKGALKVSFKIQFPNLSQQQREAIAKIIS